jgi:hypothetical protein
MSTRLSAEPRKLGVLVRPGSLSATEPGAELAPCLLGQAVDDVTRR